MPEAATVGVIANPASGRDIRRLVAGASVFDNAEKGNMVFRLMVGLGAVGVKRVLIMPAASGLYDSLDRNLRGNAAREDEQLLPELEPIEMTVRHSAHDTVEAVEAMRERGVAAIADALASGRRVAVHCGGGLGRTGTLLACYLVSAGCAPDEAIRRVRAARPGSIETPEQEQAVRRYAQRLGEGPPIA